ncbi:MAG: adenine phosphoribosyltransferase [Treponema sp.]|nr:adenine phosphoribosyltransferase [Treponema sp.]MCL2251180.1 adenine phosphoribosyltransferase [Treponema sp.]
MTNINLDDYIRKVPDFPRKGILFFDITSILANPVAFRYCIDKMAEIYHDMRVDAIAAIEARGFLFAAPFAYKLGIPVIPIRKKGKLPGVTLSKKYDLEYAQAEIEVHSSDVPRGKRILLTDDLIATGGTLNAARALLLEGGAEVPEIFGIVALPFLNFKKILDPTPVTSLIEYQSE